MTSEVRLHFETNKMLSANLQNPCCKPNARRCSPRRGALTEPLRRGHSRDPASNQEDFKRQPTNPFAPYAHRRNPRRGALNDNFLDTIKRWDSTSKQKTILTPTYGPLKPYAQ